MLPIRLIPDQAIAELNNTREDALGFSTYADVIAHIVEGTRGPFTIGVFGEWGMGKTSLMKMIERRVQTLPSSDHVIIPVWFNAWMFEKVEYPVVPLIKSVIEALKTRQDILQRTDQAAANLIHALEALVDAFRLKGRLGLPGGFAEAEAEFSPGKFKDAFIRRKNIQKHGLGHNDPYEDIFEALHSISDSAVPRNLTIMVLIDDLDRCFPENAVRLLESIKLVLSQPGFIFILGASRVVIEEYLQSKYQTQYGIAHFDGRAYLDKMIQLSFDIPPHTNRVNEFTKHIIADLGDKRTERELAPISTVIGGVCHYNPRTIIRFINRLITDSAIYRQNSTDAKSKSPVGIFAVTRSLQHSWKDFYGLLVGDDINEDREYCDIVASWSGEDLTNWKNYSPDPETHNERVKQIIHSLKNGDPEVLKQIATKLAADRVLRSLMDGKIGREWLKSHPLRETSVSFLTTQPSTEDTLVDASNPPAGAWAAQPSKTTDDDMYRDAVRVAIEGRKASTSLLQRRLRIGYGRAARLIEEMESQGIVGPADGARPREVLVSSLDEVFGNSKPAGPSSTDVKSDKASPRATTTAKTGQEPLPTRQSEDFNDYSSVYFQ